MRHIRGIIQQNKLAAWPEQGNKNDPPFVNTTNGDTWRFAVNAISHVGSAKVCRLRSSQFAHSSSTSGFCRAEPWFPASMNTS